MHLRHQAIFSLNNSVAIKTQKPRITPLLRKQNELHSQFASLPEALDESLISHCSPRLDSVSLTRQQHQCARLAFAAEAACYWGFDMHAWRENRTHTDFVVLQEDMTMHFIKEETSRMPSWQRTWWMWCAVAQSLPYSDQASLILRQCSNPPSS